MIKFIQEIGAFRRTQECAVPPKFIASVADLSFYSEFTKDLLSFRIGNRLSQFVEDEFRPCLRINDYDICLFIALEPGQMVKLT